MSFSSDDLSSSVMIRFLVCGHQGTLTQHRAYPGIAHVDVNLARNVNCNTYGYSSGYITYG